MFWHRPAERWRRSWGNTPNSLLPLDNFVWSLGWIWEEKEVVHSILLRNVQFLIEAFQSYQQFRKPKRTEISALSGVQVVYKYICVCVCTSTHLQYVHYVHIHEQWHDMSCNVVTMSSIVYLTSLILSHIYCFYPTSLVSCSIIIVP